MAWYKLQIKNLKRNNPIVNLNINIYQKFYLLCLLRHNMSKNTWNSSNICLKTQRCNEKFVKLFKTSQKSAANFHLPVVQWPKKALNHSHIDEKMNHDSNKVAKTQYSKQNHKSCEMTLVKEVLTSFHFARNLTSAKVVHCSTFQRNL